MTNLDAFEKISRECSAYGARLVAVSKTRTVPEIMRLYDAGQRIFGENKAQELTVKQNQLPGDVEWHMIGHLQRNKAKFLTPFVGMVQSLDSLRLARELDRQAAGAGRNIPVLLQVHIADEVSKYGFQQDELEGLISDGNFREFRNLTICGVMGMATFTENTSQIRREFRELRLFFDRLKSNYFPGDNPFREVSMGMSGDYWIALEEGSTLVRIGSALFGDRS